MAEPSGRGPLHEAEGVAQTVPHAAVMVTEPSNSAAPEGQLVERALDQLRAHPVYLEVCGPLASSTTPHAQADLSPIIEPLLTTRDGVILDGYELWAVARRQGRRTLPCLEYDLSEEETLTFMLNKHRRKDRWNTFCRIVIALALEPHLRARARERQSQGGKDKLSSNLTKAMPIDVRKSIACAAGVGAVNITKVKQLLKTTSPEVHEALRRGEVTIHRAWTWHCLPKKRQNEELNKYINGKSVRHDINNTIDCLLRNHQDRQDNGLSIEQFTDRLAHAAPGVLGNVKLLVTDIPGPAVVVTRDLYDQLMGEKLQ